MAATRSAGHFKTSLDRIPSVSNLEAAERDEEAREALGRQDSAASSARSGNGGGNGGGGRGSPPLLGGGPQRSSSDQRSSSRSASRPRSGNIFGNRAAGEKPLGSELV